MTACPWTQKPPRVPSRTARACSGDMLSFCFVKPSCFDSIRVQEPWSLPCIHAVQCRTSFCFSLRMRCRTSTTCAPSVAIAARSRRTFPAGSGWFLGESVHFYAHIAPSSCQALLLPRTSSQQTEQASKSLWHPDCIGCLGMGWQFKTDEEWHHFACLF